MVSCGNEVMVPEDEQRLRKLTFPHPILKNNAYLLFNQNNLCTTTMQLLSAYSFQFLLLFNIFKKVLKFNLCEATTRKKRESSPLPTVDKIHFRSDLNIRCSEWWLHSFNPPTSIVCHVEACQCVHTIEVNVPLCETDSQSLLFCHSKASFWTNFSLHPKYPLPSSAL